MDPYYEKLADRADHERTERKDREMEELWEKSRVTTPETDLHFKDNIWSVSDYGARRHLVQRDINLMKSLEERLHAEKARAEAMGCLAHGAACETAELRSRLTVARAAIQSALAVGQVVGGSKTALQEALTQTAPKP